MVARHLPAAPSTLEQVLLEHALQQVLTRYATACDCRAWHLLADVFTPDVQAHYGTWHCQGVPEIEAMIRQHLGGCGPTQHLLGNLEVDARSPGPVRSVTQVRAIHQGAGERKALRFDAIGHYCDTWVQLPQGWRIQERHMVMTHTVGDFSVLQPA